MTQPKHDTTDLAALAAKLPGSAPVGAWLKSLRLKVLAVLAAGTLAVIGVLGWLALPAIPVVGVAIITVAAVVNKMTTRLSEPICRTCGSSLEGEKPGTYGVVCRGCGAINEPPAADATRRA